MPSTSQPVTIDDRLLIKELLAGLAEERSVDLYIHHRPEALAAGGMSGHRPIARESESSPHCL